MSSERESSADTLTLVSGLQMSEFNDGQQCDIAVNAQSVLGQKEHLDNAPPTCQPSSSQFAHSSHDIVHVVRAELIHMVEQTLVAQNVICYAQELASMNLKLSQENNVMKESLVESGLWNAVVEKWTKFHSLPTANIEGHIFRFPCSTPSSMPAQLDQSVSSSGYSSPHHGQPKGHQGTSLASNPAPDGDSLSLQFSSHLSLDADHPANMQVGREASSTVAGPLTISEHHTFSGASGTDHVLVANIPNADLLDEAAYYSVSQQEAEENLIGTAGQPCLNEQFTLASDELEKMKLFLNKICKEGGISPNSVTELLNLRDKVRKLQIENSELKTELENFRATREDHSCTRQMMKLQDTIQDLNSKLEQQRSRENGLLVKLGQIGKELQQLKGEQQQQRRPAPRPVSQSEPPSSVGLQALQHIQVEAVKPCKTTQTEENPDDDLKQLKQQLVMQKSSYEKHLAGLNSHLIKVQNSDKEHEKALGKMMVELKKTSEDNQQIRSMLQETKRTHEDQLRSLQAEKGAHCQELAGQIASLGNENEKLKRSLTLEKNRNNQLDHMLSDERQRYSRDEKKLLDHVRLLTDMMKDLEVFKKLVTMIDGSKREGCRLPEDFYEQAAAALQHHRRHSSAATADSRSASPRRGNTAQIHGAGYGLAQHNPLLRSGSGVDPPSTGGLRYNTPHAQGSVLRQNNHSNMDSRGSSSFVSLPSQVMASPRHNHQNSEGASGQELDGRGGRLQRNNIAGSVPSVASPGSTRDVH